MEKIFISYASEDRSRVEIIRNKLIDRGLHIWFDRSSLPPGTQWEIEIKKAITQSYAFLVCLSSASISKKDSYQQKEIDIAREISITRGESFLIPVMLEECKLPDNLRHLQAWKLFDKEWDGLLSTLRSLWESNHSYEGEILIPTRLNIVFSFSIKLDSSERNKEELRNAFRQERQSIETKLNEITDIETPDEKLKALLNKNLDARIDELNQTTDIKWYRGETFTQIVTAGDILKRREGDIIDSRYKIRHKLGEDQQGGCSVFYRVEDLHSEKDDFGHRMPLGMKILKMDDFKNKEILEILFHNEFKNFLKISNTKNVAKMINYGRVVELASDKGVLNKFNYLIFEYVEGVLFSELNMASEALRENAIRIILPLINAIIALHEKNIFHRDLKESHIIFPRNKDSTLDFENLKLIDLGVSKEYINGADNRKKKTLRDLIKNPLSHGETRNDAEYEAKHDIFVIVQLLWKLFSGNLALSIWGEKGHEEIYRNSEDVSSRIEKALNAIPNLFVRSIIKKGLSLGYENAYELKSDLEAYQRLCEKNSASNGVDKFAVTYKDYEIFLKFDENKDWRKDNFDLLSKEGKVDQYYLLDWEKEFDPDCKKNFPPHLANYPVVFVSYRAAKDYAKWTGKQLLRSEKILEKTTSDGVHFYSVNRPMKLIKKYGPIAFLDPDLLENIGEEYKKRLHTNGPLPAIPLILKEDDDIHHLYGNTLEFSIDNRDRVWLKGIDWLNNDVIKKELEEKDFSRCFPSVGLRCMKENS